MARVRILHAHSTFSLGGKEARAVRLMNAFGDTAEHVVLSGMPGQLQARAAIDPGIHVAFPEDAPSLTGRFGLARLFKLSRYMRGFDLLLTYNWGAFDAVMARYLFARSADFPPLIHHEDGFNEDEAERLKPARNLYRRLALPTAYRLVVPSARLAGIARSAWAQDAAKIARIANGVAVEHYAGPAQPDVLPGFVRRPGDVVIGTVAGLRPVKNLDRLVMAMANLPAHVRLVIVGEGPERARLASLAAQLGLGERVVLTGFIGEPWRAYPHFDLFALSSLSEQFPISVVEAMAAGLAIVSTDVGDVADMVSADNRLFVGPADDERGFVRALHALACSADTRLRLGLANQARARLHFDERAMIAAYARLYGEAIGRPHAFEQHPG